MELISTGSIAFNSTGGIGSASYGNRCGRSVFDGDRLIRCDCPAVSADSNYNGILHPDATTVKQGVTKGNNTAPDSAGNIGAAA